jgi:hypothetical protein
MRPREEIAERLRVLTQALYLTHTHRDELSREADIRLRILEENIHQLQWCLSEPDAHPVTWRQVREAFQFSIRLFLRKLSGSGTGDRRSDEPGREGGREAS